MLEVTDLHVSYGSIEAIKGISLAIEQVFVSPTQHQSKAI